MIKKLLLRTAAVVSAAVMMISSAGFASAQKAKKYTAENFVHADGTKIIGEDGNDFHIKGIAFGNSVWDNPFVPDTSHHDEKAYKDISLHLIGF